MNENTAVAVDTGTKKKRIPKTLIIVVLTALISVLVSFTLFLLVFFADNRYVKLKELESIVKNNYYGETDEDDITDGILQGYLSGIGDKYSYYYNAEDSEDRVDSLEGNGQGIGILVVQHPDTGYIYVDRVYDASPAKKAGIKEGDQIVAIDGTAVTDSGYSQAVSSIVHEIGDAVTLDILRGEESISVTVTYSEFTVQTVFGEMLEGDIGYVRITSFNGSTPVQFENTVNTLVNEGAVGIIFDVRSNGGGTVDSVTEMVDFLCGEGDIMTATYADGSSKVIASSDTEEIDLPMTVLTDGSTASAAELFAASIKDFGKGVSIGTKTYGKGVMQSTFYLSDGSSVALTVAEFFPHSGRSFNGVGILPDIEVTLNEEQTKYFYILKPFEDPVISEAAEWLKNNG